MMRSTLLSVAAAWTAALPSAPVQPAAPAYPAALPVSSPAFLRGLPAPQAPAPQVVYAYPEPRAEASSAEMPALRAGAAVAVGALLGFGLARRQATLAVEAEDMWWGDKEYPPSRVLGIGRKVGSRFYGVTSGLAFAVGVYCVAQSNLLNILSGSTVNGWYVAGALLVPYSWGLHVASWIQKQNEEAGTLGQ